MKISEEQAKFYDLNPPLTPWPYLLKEYGFSCLYKPREIFWKKNLDSLEIKTGSKILEIGCGEGLFLSRIVKHYKVHGTGVDVSAESVKFANENYRNEKLFFLKEDAEKLSFKNNSFDFVVSFDALEHIENKEKVIKEMIRVLKPGGKLLIYALSKNYNYTLDWFWEKIGIDIFSRAAHNPDLFINIDFLKRKIKENGMSIIELNLFNAFFTLLLDESIMVLSAILKRLNMFQSKIIGKIFLAFTSLISGFLFPMCQFLDSFWYSKGYSLSILIISEKDEEKKT